MPTPVLVDYTPGVDLMQLAANAGAAQGRSAYMSQQRGIDARVQQQAIEQAQRSAAAPTFAQQHTGTGQTQYEGQGPVQTFVNEPLRAQAAQQRQQYEQVYGNPVQQQARQQQVQEVQQYAQATGRGNAPEIGSYVGAIKRGEKAPAQIEAGAIGPTPTDEARGNNARANVIRATRPTTAPLNMAESRKLQDRVRAAYDTDPSIIADALGSTDLKTGGPSQQMIDLMGGLNDPSVDPAQRLQRAAELAAAGAPPTAVAAIQRRALAQQQEQANQTRSQGEKAKLATTAAEGLISQIQAGTLSPEEAPLRAQQMGIPMNVLEDLIFRQWEEAERPIAPR